VVTGGNRGIGRAMALGLARAGGSVAVLARNAEHDQLVLAELKTIGKPALVLRLDVTDRAALATSVAEVERTLGGIDISINNAGIVALTGGGRNETADIWDATIETHHKGFQLTKSLAIELAP
jgi:NAD(P)-dependent dehydrogenase (short-subunit alcohol dehydrogenase family)